MLRVRIEDKALEGLWNELRGASLRRAKSEGAPYSDAEDMAMEVIKLLLETVERKQEEVRKPVHWGKKALKQRWQAYLVHRSRMVGVDFTADLDAPGVTEGSKRLRRYLVGHALVVLRHDPALVVEQRDLLAKIDPQWREHLEYVGKAERGDGDFTKHGNLNPAVRRRIVRRAARVLREL